MVSPVLTAVLDESSPHRPDGTIVYVLAAVLLDAGDTGRIAGRLSALFPRPRPFHWEDDRGSEVRGRMVGFIMEERLRLFVAGAGVTQPKLQNPTRKALLEQQLLPALAGADVEQLLIETRSQAENGKDIECIRNWYRERRPRSTPLVGSTLPSR